MGSVSLEKQRKQQRFSTVFWVRRTRCLLRAYIDLVLALADPERPESALNSIPKAVLHGARGTYSHHITAKDSPFILHYYRTGYLPSPQGRLRLLRESRLRPRHRAPPRWLMVRTLVHRNRGPGLGSPDRRRHHRFRRRAQQRRRRPGVLNRRQRDHRWKH